MQMRVIQKALLVRYKEDKPTELASLPLLMEAAFEEITGMADAVLKVDAALVTARDSLARATRLTLCCLRCADADCERTFEQHITTIRVEIEVALTELPYSAPILCFVTHACRLFLPNHEYIERGTNDLLQHARRKCAYRCRCPSMTDAESAEYAAHLSPQLQCADEFGWEETTDAALVQLLRGKLARGSREQAAQPSLAGPLQQCGTLTKHVAIMLERVEELHAG